MRIVLLLLSILAYDGVCASFANLLADRALKQLTAWINAEGSTWLTLPSYYKTGEAHNEEFTLAIAGPKMGKIGSIARSGEAQLADGDSDPLYETSQTLRFVATFRNITVNYDHISYNGNANGLSHLTSTATSDGVSVEIAIDLKGHGDSCMASADSMDVSYNGSLWVTVNPANQKATPVVDAVTAHFKNNVPKAVRTLMKSATFDSLEYYDVCTGVYYPQSPPNVLADSLLNFTSNLLRTNISDWAVLPSFSKVSLVNDTTFDIIRVAQGNFSSFESIKRVGVASYENRADPKSMDLKVSFEITNLTAAYGKIEYVDYTVWFPLAELVIAPKIETTLTVTFTRKTPSSVPSCVNGGVSVVSKYSRDERLLYTNLSPGLPDYVIRSTNEVLGPGFLETVEGAVNDLFLTATKYSLAKMCT